MNNSIRSFNVEGVLRNITGLHWDIDLQTTSAAYHMTGILNGVLVGGAPAQFAPFFLKGMTSLAITTTLGGVGSTATFRLTGENQFGEVVSELITFTQGAGVTQQTLFCYRRITAMAFTIINGLGTGQAFQAGDTLGFGYSIVNPRLPMPAKLHAIGSVLAVKTMGENTGDSAQLPFRAVTVGTGVIAAETVGQEFYNILLTGTLPIGSGSVAYMTVVLDPSDGGL